MSTRSRLASIGAMLVVSSALPAPAASAGLGEAVQEAESTAAAVTGAVESVSSTVRMETQKTPPAAPVEQAPAPATTPPPTRTATPPAPSPKAPIPPPPDAAASDPPQRLAPRAEPPTAGSSRASGVEAKPPAGAGPGAGAGSGTSRRRRLSVSAAEVAAAARWIAWVWPAIAVLSGGEPSLMAAPEGPGPSGRFAAALSTAALTEGPLAASEGARGSSHSGGAGRREAPAGEVPREPGTPSVSPPPGDGIPPLYFIGAAAWILLIALIRLRARLPWAH